MPIEDRVHFGDRTAMFLGNAPHALVDDLVAVHGASLPFPFRLANPDAAFEIVRYWAEAGEMHDRNRRAEQPATFQRGAFSGPFAFCVRRRAAVFDCQEAAARRLLNRNCVPKRSPRVRRHPILY
jgi:hypothetical protein